MLEFLLPRRSGLGRKLVLCVIVTNIVVLLIAGSIFILRSRHAQEHQLQERLGSLARVLGRNSAVAMLFDRRDEVVTVLSSAGGDDEILAGAVYRPDGTLFAEWHKPDGPHTEIPTRLPAEADVIEHVHGAERMRTVRPVRADDQDIGRILLVADTSGIRAETTRLAGSLAVGLLASLLAGTALALFLQRFVTRPLSRVADTARAIADRQDYTMRVPLEGGGREVHELATAFNGMLAQVQKRDEALARHGEELERKVAERTQQLERVNRQLAEAVDRERAAGEAKSNFLANMSHEIRTPMNGVLGLTDVVLDTDLDDEQRHLLEQVQRSGRALITVINDILDFSKIEAGRLEIRRQDFAPRDLVEDVLAILEPAALRKDLALRGVVSPDVPEVVRGDPDRIRQILLNLAGNAIKFTESGEVRVRFAVERGRPDDLDVHVSVSDTGIGIPEDKIDTVFDVFEQVDPSRTRRHGGTGLGLAICKRLVELMDGSLWVESTVGRGSTFHFTLGLERARGAGESADAAPDDADRPTASTSTADRPPRVLVAEDNTVNIMVARKTLEGMGCAVDVAENGRLALDAVRAAETPYDAVLMDIQMPEMDGLEATRRLRDWERERAVEHPLPVIAVTAHAREEDAQQCREAGMDDVVTKPIRREDLAAALVRCGVVVESGAPNGGDS